MATLELIRLSKRYQDVVSVDAIDLSVSTGEFLCLLGPSGCGKTTTLRMIAGLADPDDGEVRVDGNVMSSVRMVVPPERRGMSMIFQSYAVWPHMTVRENVAYGLKAKPLPAEEKRRRTDTFLAATKLEGLAERYPAEISGGQQQRVALARALAPRPAILLLDEPLSNLDANLRGEMRFEIRRLHQEFKCTSVYVTHDQVEAMTMADRIVVMNAGRIEQIGTPKEVYDAPNSAFVARFIGGSNVLKARHLGARAVDVSGHALEIGGGDFAGQGADMAICVKTHHLELLPAMPTSGEGNNVLPGVVRSQAYLGSHRDYIVDVGQEVQIGTSADVDVAPGSRVAVRFPRERCRGLAR